MVSIKQFGKFYYHINKYDIITVMLIKILQRFVLCIGLLCFVLVNLSSNVTGSGANGWYHQDWDYRKKIQIDHTKVESDLTNTPVLVNIASDNNIRDNALANADDIVFSSIDGSTKYHHEIEKYDSSTGGIVAWVNLPSLSSVVNTEFYIYYGNPLSSNQESNNQVWPDNLVSNYHLNNDPSTPSYSQIKDSASGDLSGTTVGSMTLSDKVSAKIGDGIDFDGSNDYISIPRIPHPDTISDYEVPGGFTNTGIAYDSTEDVLWNGNYDDGSIVKTSMNGTQLDQISTTAPQLQGVAYDSSNDSLWYVSFGGTSITNIDKNGSVLTAHTVSVTGGTNGITYVPSNDSLWVSGPNSSTIKRYDASTGAELQTLTLGISNVDGIFYDEVNNYLWATVDSNLLYRLNTSTGAVIKVFASPHNNIEHLTVDTSDNTLYVNHDEEFHSFVPDGNRVWQHSIDPSSPELATVDNFTISAWVYPRVISGNQMIFENRGSGGTSTLFNLFIRSTGAVSTFVGSSLDSATGQILANNWYYITATYDGTTAKIYKNGIQIATGARSRAAVHDGDTTLGVLYNGTSTKFNGIFDEARIYKTALTAEEIQTSYNNQNDPGTFISLGTQEAYSDFKLVTYSGNSNTGGVVPTDLSSPYAPGSTVTVAGNTGSLTKTGHTFNGWNTQSDGLGIDYTPAATFTVNSDTTLYAQWTANTYDVAFDGNGSTGGTMSNQSYTYGTAQNLSANSYTRAGYTFVEWNTSANGSGTGYTDTQSVNNLTAADGGTVTLYAQWTDDSDGDDIQNSIEDAAINDGDGNDDGMDDSSQSNVTSFINQVDGKYVTIVAEESCTLTAISADTEASNTTQDAGYEYSGGLVSFTAECAEQNGFTSDFNVIFHGVAKENLALRKYNSTTNTYSSITGAGLTDWGLEGQTSTVAEYSVTDGSSYDSDGIANGTIVDPVGLGQRSADRSGPISSILPSVGQSTGVCILIAGLLSLLSLMFISLRKRGLGKY